jgi:hypothetical protein
MIIVATHFFASNIIKMDASSNIMSTTNLKLDSLEPVIEAEDHGDDVSSAYSEDTDQGSAAKVTTSMKERAAKSERESLGAEETRNILYLRFFAFMVLLLTAILVCLGVYFYTKRDEEEDFEYVYEASAERVIMCMKLRPNE